MIACPRPRVVSVRRRLPDRVSAGDTAEARLDPRLIGLLDSDLGAGYHAPYNVPVCLSATAAMAVLAPSIGAGTDWGGREVDVEWSGTPGIRDAVLAQARLEDFSERLARFAVEGRTLGGRPLYRGTLQMMGVRAGVPVGFGSPAEHAAARTWLAGERDTPRRIALGASAVVEVPVANPGADSATVTVAAELPYGAGLSIDGPAAQTVPLAAGATGRACFTVRADRPHEVNLGKPWELVFRSGGATSRVLVEVPDPEPGRTFYLLTEDCETFDGGPLTGNYRGSESLGNHNNFMDPEDYRVQMIQKPNRLNEIADRYGAKWTHFYAATQRFGAEWAAAESRTGVWPRVIAEMDESVRAASERHEYSPHIHFDYEPASSLPPQPRLIYDAATDGILPNDYYHPETNPTHRYHDWDGAARGTPYIKTLGDWSELDSKAGSLRKTMRHLARLEANRRSPLVARTGSYDFGVAAEDQAISTAAYQANGLRGNSDVYRPGAAPRPGGQLYWCSVADRREPIADLCEARLAQFAITMDSGFASAEEMNHWFAAERDACRGPGVHAILFTTHAMFFAGQPDPFRSLEGGAFEQLDRHLAWVYETYTDIAFATATEALLEFLDYYTPELEAYTEPLLCGGDPAAGRFEFPVRLLGRGIRVDGERPADVRITPPPCFSPDELAELRVLADGREIASERGFDARRQPAVTVRLAGRPALRLEVVVKPEAAAAAARWFGDVFHDPPEAPGADLLRLRPDYPDVARLLMHPVAGGAEPLGRRIHPLGGFAIGAALEAAGGVPVRMKLRWLRPVDLQSAYVTEKRGSLVRIRGENGELIAQAEVTVRAIVESVKERDEFEEVLATYRSQRAWKVMLAVRKVYDVLARGSWRQRLGLVVWIPRALLGRAPGLEEYELKFPRR